MQRGIAPPADTERCQWVGIIDGPYSAYTRRLVVVSHVVDQVYVESNHTQAVKCDAGALNHQTDRTEHVRGIESTLQVKEALLVELNHTQAVDIMLGLMNHQTDRVDHVRGSESTLRVVRRCEWV